MKRVSGISLLLLILFLIPAQTYAEEPYRGYNYNSYYASVPAPNIYGQDRCITGGTLGIKSFNNPEDIFVEKETQIVYVLDSGNKRVVMLDDNLGYMGVIDKYYDNGKEMEVGNMTGIYVVPSIGIYLADADNSRILCIDFKGNLIHTYGKPDSNLYTQKTFLPQKVLVDSAQNVYAICTGAYQGAVVYDSSGRFTGYYGSTKVIPTVKIIMESFWKKIMTREQTGAMERYVPVEYVNFDIDNSDFIYTVTQTQNSISKDTIRKLNPAGSNIMKTENAFGDLETYVEQNNIGITQFYDIHVDEDGFIYALDITGEKIFEYDSDGNLISVFGRMGSQNGTFKHAVAVDSMGSTILVLDKRKNDLTSFELTEFGKYVHDAIMLYNKGLYEQAEKPWLEVIKRDSNYEMAYVGLGKAAMNMYRYEEAMGYFKLGNNRIDYSKAYKQYRVDFVRDHFTIITACILLAILILLLIKHRKRLKSLIKGIRAIRSFYQKKE